MKKGEETSQLIVHAAEKEFLEKGYAQSKTTDIARVAGVTHAMLHYYFGTKEKLFNRVFCEKMQALAVSLLPIVEQDIPFEQKVRTVIEMHFDFLTANPRVPLFIISEMATSAERREMCKNVFLPVFKMIAKSFSREIERETEAGNIVPIRPMDLLMDVVALNLFPFMSRPMMELLYGEFEKDADLLARRKAENVEVILRRIRK